MRNDTCEYNGLNYGRMDDDLIRRVGLAMQHFSNSYRLTRRESEILILIAACGYTNREIAEKCTISEKTVKNHLANIMNKVRIRSVRKLHSLLLYHALHS